MSRSPSPVSSLDFPDSDDSEEAYRPRAATRRRAPAKGSTVVRLNLSAAKSVATTAALHAVEGDVEDDDGRTGGYEDNSGDRRRALDMSMQELKGDHMARPLWVDEEGSM